MLQPSQIVVFMWQKGNLELKRLYHKFIYRSKHSKLQSE